MLQLYWTRHKFWIVAGLAAFFNVSAAGFSLITFLRYVASHPGSLGHGVVYLRLLFPATNLSLGVWILYRTREAYREIKRAQQARDAATELERQRLARIFQQIEEVHRLRRIARNEHPFIANLADPAGIMGGYFDAVELIENNRTPEENANIKAKAAANLTRVVKALNCTPVSGAFGFAIPAFEFKTKDGTHFVVDTHYIHKLGPIRHEMTCYNLAVPCPLEEKIATALLQLNRNPEIFDMMKNFQGRWIC